MTSARVAAPLGTLLIARSELGPKMWRDEARRGRAGQAFKLGEPGVVDGTTANSLAASYRGPRQDGQVGRRIRRGRTLANPGPGPEANASPLTNEPAA